MALVDSTAYLGICSAIKDIYTDAGINVHDDRIVSMAASHDKAAQDQLIICYHRLIVELAYKMAGYITQNGNSDVDDLIQVGNIALLEAADHFDSAKGVKFITCAYKYIINALYVYQLRNGSMISVSTNKQELNVLLSRETASFFAENGRYPTDLELSQRTGIPEKRISKIRAAFRKRCELDTANREKRPDNIEDDIIEEERIEIALSLIENFSGPNAERDKILMYYLYGLKGYPCLPVKEISEKFGITEAGVRYICNRRLEQIRSSNQLRSYFDRPEISGFFH